jgi:hypothetical protein
MEGIMNEETFICPCCQIGHCHPGRVTYVAMADDQPVIVPDVLAWTCDVCQYREYDREAIRQLESLLGQGEAGADAPRSSKTAAIDPSVTPRRAKP